MKRKNRENEYRGIVSIIVIVILAIILVYYYSHYSSSPNETQKSNIPLEAPSPPAENTGGI
ncbi:MULTISPECIES: hypothetical protein [Legionella]|uniref:Uncharacterized protein n=1 Tax=Legionella resiliens TaxID=2905958 RepID=A0ABS8XBN4_9GAMM|nr:MULTISPECIES: hypothetical protein [unclassified Legionella]MCE0724352.1 hypothetical protein [Legionella sp. 9fVS26]MCE3533504.1 hypothetical protein [Legionella sp. 8cVS16]QLZ69691.1 hypothetical protein FOLKNPGA_02489 [Legionella sp. PC1000]